MSLRILFLSVAASDGASERRASGLDMQRILDLNKIDGDDNNVTFTSHAINYLSSRLRFDCFCFNFFNFRRWPRRVQSVELELMSAKLIDGNIVTEDDRKKCWTMRHYRAKWHRCTLCAWNTTEVEVDAAVWIFNMFPSTLFEFFLLPTISSFSALDKRKTMLKDHIIMLTYWLIDWLINWLIYLLSLIWIV